MDFDREKHQHNRSPRWRLWVSLGAVLLFATVLFSHSSAINSDPSNLTAEPSCTQGGLSCASRELPTPRQCKNWIVITTIFPLSADVKKLANITGWCLLVIGDLQTPKYEPWPNVDYLSVEAQLCLPYKLISHIPCKSYGRKNIGFLYAIQHGAEQIYDADVDNTFKSGKTIHPFELRVDDAAALDIYITNGSLVNPYAHFGLPKVFPRGFPLTKRQVGAVNNSYCRAGYHLQQPLVQQFVADGNPDVDALYRLEQPLPVFFCPHAAAVMIPPLTFAPYNCQATLYQRDAFWGLLLPITTKWRVADIWRGYWVQRLLWHISGGLAFLDSGVIHHRYRADYFNDYEQETELYTQSHKLISFLSHWRLAVGDSEVSLFYAVRQLGKDLYKAGFWGSEDSLLVQYWSEDLQSLGYVWPELIDHAAVENLAEAARRCSARVPVDYKIDCSDRLTPETEPGGAGVTR